MSMNKPRLFKQISQSSENTLKHIHTANEKFGSPISDNESAQDILFPMVHELLADLNQIFHDAEEQGYPKEELCFSIQKTLKQYKQLDQSAFQGSINNHITDESKNKCSILLSEDEVKMLWVQ